MKTLIQYGNDAVRSRRVEPSVLFGTLLQQLSESSVVKESVELGFTSFEIQVREYCYTATEPLGIRSNTPPEKHFMSALLGADEPLLYSTVRIWDRIGRDALNPRPSYSNASNWVGEPNMPVAPNNDLFGPSHPNQKLVTKRRMR